MMRCERTLRPVPGHGLQSKPINTRHAKLTINLAAPRAVAQMSAMSVLFLVIMLSRSSMLCLQFSVVFSSSSFPLLVLVLLLVLFFLASFSFPFFFFPFTSSDSFVSGSPIHVHFSIAFCTAVSTISSFTVCLASFLSVPIPAITRSPYSILISAFIFSKLVSIASNFMLTSFLKLLNMSIFSSIVCHKTCSSSRSVAVVCLISLLSVSTSAMTLSKYFMSPASISVLSSLLFVTSAWKKWQQPKRSHQQAAPCQQGILVFTRGP
eukprot:NODE_1465_length_1135_cov_583.573148.p1 GENE.NODE_1465_length_1135_cov_583.573148~~NODE_1465_length_1135_cov_583.573148.p1  ORF type:complete len:306 (+),score=93.49 NODE_1465_length_1135_cov_583.573148:125-919(+)